MTLPDWWDQNFSSVQYWLLWELRFINSRSEVTHGAGLTNFEHIVRSPNCPVPALYVKCWCWITPLPICKSCQIRLSLKMLCLAISYFVTILILISTFNYFIWGDWFQAHALLARRSIELFEELLRNFDTPLEWVQHEAFIPSFSEVYPLHAFADTEPVIQIHNWIHWR